MIILEAAGWTQEKREGNEKKKIIDDGSFHEIILDEEGMIADRIETEESMITFPNRGGACLLVAPTIQVISMILWDISKAALAPSFLIDV